MSHERVAAIVARLAAEGFTDHEDDVHDPLVTGGIWSLSELDDEDHDAAALHLARVLVAPESTGRVRKAACVVLEDIVEVGKVTAATRSEVSDACHLVVTDPTHPWAVRYQALTTWSSYVGSDVHGDVSRALLDDRTLHDWFRKLAALVLACESTPEATAARFVEIAHDASEPLPVRQQVTSCLGRMKGSATARAALLRIVEAPAKHRAMLPWAIAAIDIGNAPRARAALHALLIDGKQTEDVRLRCLARTAGESSDMLADLWRIALDRTEPRPLRAKAMYALHRYVHDASVDFMRFAIVARDKTESRSVRDGAFDLLLAYGATRTAEGAVREAALAATAAFFVTEMRDARASLEHRSAAAWRLGRLPNVATTSLLLAALLDAALPDALRAIAAHYLGWCPQLVPEVQRAACASACVAIAERHVAKSYAARQVTGYLKAAAALAGKSRA